MIIRMRTEYGDWKAGHTGKGRFVKRLASHLGALGCVVTDSLEEQVDIDFQIARHHYKPVNCSKTVLRIGPAHVDKKKNHKWLNSRKKKALNRSDGIIYQSYLGKKMVRKFICKPKGIQATIYNGAPGVTYENIQFDITTPKNYIACARTWSPQKRLKTIVEAFSLLEDATLWVCGDVDVDVRKYKNVRPLGVVNDHVLRQLYGFCDAHVHLVWLDCMPNSVCESLAAGVPTVCNSMSGTAEVVRKSGGVVIDEPRWGYKPVDVNKPPVLNADVVAEAMEEAACREVDSSVVDISSIATQYYDFFKRVLRG